MEKSTKYTRDPFTHKLLNFPEQKLLEFLIFHQRTVGSNGTINKTQNELFKIETFQKTHKIVVWTHIRLTTLCILCVCYATRSIRDVIPEIF